MPKHGDLGGTGEAVGVGEAVGDGDGEGLGLVAATETLLPVSVARPINWAKV